MVTVWGFRELGLCAKCAVRFIRRLSANADFLSLAGLDDRLSIGVAYPSVYRPVRPSRGHVWIASELMAVPYPRVCTSGFSNSLLRLSLLFVKRFQLSSLHLLLDPLPERQAFVALVAASHIILAA